MDIYYIYGLVDPRNSELRYVGVSKSPHLRLSQHLCHARKANSRMAASQWIAELLECDLKPTLVILEEYETDWPPEAREVESQWIDHCLKNGEHLLNRIRPQWRIRRWSNILPGKEPHLKFDKIQGWYYSYE